MLSIGPFSNKSLYQFQRKYAEVLKIEFLINTDFYV